MIFGFFPHKKFQDMLKRAFTLLELMLVVLIIGIIVSIVGPRLTGRSVQAKISAATADVSANIPLALDLFQMDNGRFPTTEEGLLALRTNPGSLPKWRGPYFKKEPKDPWGKTYLYKSPGTHNSDYDLYSTGPNGMENDQDDIINW